jgi:hypothetical protein
LDVGPTVEFEFWSDSGVVMSFREYNIKTHSTTKKLGSYTSDEDGA